MSNKTLKIGTRGSALALTQTRMVEDALKAAHPDLHTEIVIIKTSGDWKPTDGETPLPERSGGKALFAKEIEESLIRGDIDIAVHSMKDMDSTLPDGLSIDHMLPRVDPRDALLFHDRSLKNTCIEDLPDGFTIGTTSPRRKALLLNKNANLNIVPFRGNVPTRIEKLRSKQVDATMLAVAGLTRLNLSHEIDQILEIHDFTPSTGQGAVGIERRKRDTKTAGLLDKISCTNTVSCVLTERAILQALDGSCKTSIGINVILQDDKMIINTSLLTLDGKAVKNKNETFRFKNVGASISHGETIGKTLKEEYEAFI